MTAMVAARRGRGRWHVRSAARGLGAFALAFCALALAGGCGTGHPSPLRASALAEAQTFPYFPVYWVGRSFEGYALGAVDGRKTYISTVGDSVYYGDCAHGKGIFGGGSCLLPLQVTTTVYQLRSNAALGPQRNLLLRGVPATAYDEGRSLELYSGRVAIDVFSDTPARALRAVARLLPVNAPGSAGGKLPTPVYCPGLVGELEPAVQRVMAHLPAHICQRTLAATEITKKLS
jgi:hypothetical protein